jgi:hypothetical protein
MFKIPAATLAAAAAIAGALPAHEIGRAHV